MLRHLILPLCLLLAAGCSPAGGAGGDTGSGEAAAQTAEGPPAGAEDAITTWYRAQFGVDLIEPVDIFYGDFSGDGAPDALAFGYFQMGGSGAGLSVALFRNQAGRMTFARAVDDVYGMEPRDVAFSTGQITLTTTMPRPGDPHCCPTGSQNWTINTN